MRAAPAAKPTQIALLAFYVDILVKIDYLIIVINLFKPHIRISINQIQTSLKFIIAEANSIAVPTKIIDSLCFITVELRSALVGLMIK